MNRIKINKENTKVSYGGYFNDLYFSMNELNLKQNEILSLSKIFKNKFKKQEFSILYNVLQKMKVALQNSLVSK